MTIEAGTRLGPYEVIAPIGAGGMGEVYKANDTRLDRIVAIKVLPEHLAESPERKARFEREAKAISQLNHPHICTLYDVGEQDGIDFIVMEYIEGETLAERLKKGGLKLDQALEYGIQIADGLDTAHRAGIVHRDLKPGNVMLTKSGVKLLDFGLARLVHEEDEAPVTSDAPTRQRDLTGEESIIGTLQYMAPEQLERKPADARTDIFAFGALLYEMITGKKAFEGTSQASLIGAILEREPESISTFQPLASLVLERVVKKCLAKNPEDRYHSMHDLADEIRWIREGSDESAGKAGTGESRLRPGIGFFVGALLAGLAVFVLLVDSGPSSRAVRFSIAVLEEFAGSTNTMTAIAPDGSRFAYVANDVIHVREVDQLEARPLAATEGDPQALTFSPDGEWIAYWTNGELKKAPVSGGTPVQLCEVEVPFGLLWTDDDVLRFGLSSGGIWEVEGDGGTLKSVMSTAEAVWRPQLLPDGRTYLFVSAFSPYRIAVQSTEDTEARVLSEGGLNPRYVETGHLLFQMSNELMAVPFDLERLVLIGSPVPVIEASDWQFDVSRNGTLLYVPPALPNTRIVWVDCNGNVSLAVDERQLFSRPHLSQDGRRVAVEIRSSFSERDLWVYDLERGSRTRVTSGDAAEQDPVWTPDGERIVFTLSNADSGDLFSIFADGNGEPTLLLASDVTMDPHSFSPDGKHLAYYERRGASRDIWVFDLDKKEPQPFVVTEFNERSPSFSPDGRFIAYVSNASGRDEVYVQPYPGPGRLTVISTGGGYGPVWSRDGKELFYRHGKRMMAVRVQSGPRFRASVPETLFEGEFLTEEGSDSGSRTYDVSLDGKRFLMVERGETRAEIHVVVNWFEELEQLVPIK